MRWMLVLGFMVTSSLSGAERPANPPWERDWSANAGDCVAIGQMPKGVSCKLFSQGAGGFNMRIYVYDAQKSKFMGAEPFMAVASKLCEAVGSKVTINFIVDRNERTVVMSPPSCREPIIS